MNRAVFAGGFSLLLVLAVPSAARLLVWPEPAAAAGGSEQRSLSGATAGAGLQAPAAIAVNASGNLYIADSSRNVVWKVARSGAITIAAGTGTPGYSGDRGPATKAKLNDPEGVAVDAAGNLYIADSNNNVVRKVERAGTISTIAGTGKKGFSGDGGLATHARLYSPTGVATDAGGNLFIADSANNVVRRIDRVGAITTVAGDGKSGYTGDGSSATKAELDNPVGVAVDRTGDLYIAEADTAGANVIRKVDRAGTITTVVGPTAQLNYPREVAVDAAGNLYIADTFNNWILKVTRTGRTAPIAGGIGQSFCGDGGPATKAALAVPSGVAVDANGNVYIADTGNGVVRKVNRAGTITTIAGKPPHSSSICG